MSFESEIPENVATALRKQGRTVLNRCAVASAIVLAALLLSIVGDVEWPGHHLTARAGAWIAGLGGYIAYITSVGGRQLLGDDTELADYYVSPRLAKVGVWLLIIGTLLWGYGDLFY